jgi:hypothetical protein
MAEEEKVTWKKVGKYEHCLPEATFEVRLTAYDGKKLTEKELERLLDAGSPAVRKAVKEAKPTE